METIIILAIVVLFFVIAVEIAIVEEERFGYVMLVIAGFMLFGLGYDWGSTQEERTSKEILTPSIKTVCEEVEGVKTCDTTYIYKFKKETEDE